MKKDKNKESDKAKDEKKKAYKKRDDNNITALKFALNNQIGWQKFAEAKLLLLLTVSGTSIASLNSILEKFESVKSNLDFIIIITLFAICSFASFLIVLISFYVSFNRIKNSRKFGSIQMISWEYVISKEVDDLIEISKEYNHEEHRRDLVIQHHLGSRLTDLKYKFFNYGVVIYLIGIITFFIYLLINKVFLNYA